MHFLIHLHDGQLDDPKLGSAAGRIGHRGTIGYAYQVEMWLQQSVEMNWRRAYAMQDGRIRAIWARAGETFSYVARDQTYNGEWQLPFLYPGRRQIATASYDSTSFANAERWAASQLRRPDIATAILLDGDRVAAAWEPGPTGAVLIAKVAGLK